jgi:thymidylate kinase
MEPTQSAGRQVTPDAELLLLIGRWRARARELLAQAETMLDAEARQMMRDTAAKYERLAQQVEQRTGTADA